MSQDILSRNNVRVFGAGSQPMMFAHGFGCDQNMWRFITPAFEDDYRIVLFDYVGAGKSDLNAYDAERYSRLTVTRMTFWRSAMPSICGTSSWSATP